MAHAQTHPAPQGGAIDIHQLTDWRASIAAGLIAGVVFLILEMLMATLMGDGPWAPPRMIAAILMGRAVLPPPADFVLVPVLAALFIHFALSVAYGLAIGWMVHQMDMGAAIVAGAAFGLIAAYFVNFYLIAPTFFPWFVEARNWMSVLAHLVFGAVAAAAYVGLRKVRA